MEHPCECRGDTLDCQSRHLSVAIENLGKALVAEAQKARDSIVLAWKRAFKKPTGDG